MILANKLLFWNFISLSTVGMVAFISTGCQPRKFNDDNNKVKNVQSGSDTRLGGLDGWNETLLISRYVDVGTAQNYQRFACFYSSTMKIRNKDRLDDPLDKKLRRHFKPNFVEKHLSGANGFKNVVDINRLVKMFPDEDYDLKTKIAQNQRPYAINIKLLPDVLNYSINAKSNIAHNAYGSLKENQESLKLIGGQSAILTSLGALSLAPAILLSAFPLAAVPGAFGVMFIFGGAAVSTIAPFPAAGLAKNAHINFRATQEKQALASAMQVSVPQNEQVNLDWKPLSEQEIAQETHNENQKPADQKLVSGLKASKGLGIAIEMAHAAQLLSDFGFEKKNDYVLKDDKVGVCPPPSEIIPSDLFK